MQVVVALSASSCRQLRLRHLDGVRLWVRRLPCWRRLLLLWRQRAGGKAIAVLRGARWLLLLLLLWLLLLLLLWLLLLLLLKLLLTL